MEMASAHGLALKLVEMSRLDRINRNECEIISEEDRVIKSWFVASNQKFSRPDYVNLTRKTLLFVLSQLTLKEVKKKELLKGVSMYFNKFASILKYLDIRKPLVEVIVNPWMNAWFLWEELFHKRITFRDKKVQGYFCSEPEEIVCARVHLLLLQGKEEMAMILAKSSFLYYSRILKSLSFLPEHQIHNHNSNSAIPKNKFKRGTASMDWYLSILQRKKSLIAIFNEVKKLTCHEGVLLIQRLRRNKKNLNFTFNLCRLFLMQELTQPSKFCCTKKIFSLWCILHKEQKTSIDIIIQEVRKIMPVYSPSSAHFYLLVDALWEQFGSSFITLYVELYVRGLTVDLNHLEAARHGEIQDDIIYLESHIASMFTKLSTLFSDFHEGASRECMFSAFSLKPTKERLYILQSLTHSILSTENEIKSNLLIQNSTSLLECKCAVKCTESCKSIKEHILEHPILMKGIPNVPYCVVKDLVTVLEGVRCIQFQYNLFDWHNNATDLGDYLRDFTLSKSWESDTEYASEGSVKGEEDNTPSNETLYAPAGIEIDYPHSSTKRKGESDNLKKVFPLEIGANIEVESGDSVNNKRIKVVDENENSQINKPFFGAHVKPAQKFGSTLGMEDAIENVIRMTLDNNRLKSDLSLDNSHSTFVNASVDHANDGTEKVNLSSSFKHTSENHVYPYSFTSFGKKISNNLNANFKVTDCKSPVKPDLESSIKYAYFDTRPSTSSQVIAPSQVNRESVISPIVYKHNNFSIVQEQPCKQIAQNKYFVKSANSPCSKVNDATKPTVDIGKKKSMYQQDTLNLDCKNAMYEQMKNVSQSSHIISKQTAMQVLHKSDISTSNFSKVQCLPNRPVVSSSSMPFPFNLSQSKIAMHSSHHVSKSSSVSRYQVDNSSTSRAVMKKVDQSMSCFQKNEIVHCDRSSVIQHTMQQVRENRSSDVAIPNQFPVSLNSNAAEQLRSVPTENIKTLPPFTVNVNDRAISNSNLAVKAHFVIARKSQPQVELPSSPPVCRDPETVQSTDTITISGILASPSVIVSPWEAQHKVHGEMLYKKNSNAVNVSSIDKRIYKNRIPYGRPIYFKPELKMVGQKSINDKINSQVFKAVTNPTHTDTSYQTLPSISQSNTNSIQSFTAVNKSSTQDISQPTSSQPWYSEPYPKSYNNGNSISSKSSTNINITDDQNTSSNIKKLQPTKHTSEVKFPLFSKGVQSSDNHQIVNPSAGSSVFIPFNNPIPSSEKSSVLNVSTLSSPNSSTCAVPSESIFNKDHISSILSRLQSNSMITVKTYSTKDNPVTNNSVYSDQLSNKLQPSTNMVQDRNHKVTDVVDSNLHYSQVAPQNYRNSCCSPSEMNPCQNCSLSTENRLIQSTVETNSGGHPDHMISSSNKTIKGNDSSTIHSCNSNISSNKDNADGLDHSNSDINASSTCQYCSHPFLKTDLQLHILNCQSKGIAVKNSLIDGINSNIPETFCTKPLLDVPEQNYLFQEQSFPNDLPHAKSFVNSVENPQCLEEDEENAFRTCMDLINNDNDLKRIVQGFDALEQIDNNYLPFIPSDTPGNFINTNLCNEIKEEICDKVPIKNITLSKKNNEFNNYTINSEKPQLQKNKLDVGKSFNSVFEFTEKQSESSKSTHKLIHPNSESYTQRALVNTSKTSNELTFSTVSEMIKMSVTECDYNELKVIKTVKNNEKEISPTIANLQKNQSAVFSCPYCSKKLCSDHSVRRHITKVHSNIHVNNSEKLSERLADLSPTDKPGCNFEFEKDMNSRSENCYGDNSLTLAKLNQSEISPTIANSHKIQSALFSCPYCFKKLCSALSVKRHITKLHSNIHVNDSEKLSDKSACYFQNEKDIISGRENCYDGSSLNHAKLNQSEISSTIESFHKIHSTVFSCPYCSKKLRSDNSVKRHITKVHSKMCINNSQKLSEKFADLSYTDKSACNSQLENNINYGRENFHDSNSLNQAEISQREIPPTILTVQKVYSPVYSCPHCSKKLCSPMSVKRHIIKLHPNDSERFSERIVDLSSTDKPGCDFQFKNVINSESDNFYDSNSLNYAEQCKILLTDTKQNPEVPNTCERSDVLPKGKIKDIKPPKSPCKFCGKILTSLYMKKHILNQHPEILIKGENSCSNLNTDVNISSQSQSEVDSINVSTLSPLFEQDIDSSTCLSVSDALKRNNSYVVAETSNLPEGHHKFIENTDIKFNFNVLELSKDTKVPVSGAALLKFENFPPENEKRCEGNFKNIAAFTKKSKCADRHVCNYCQKSYTFISALYKHLENIHGITDMRTFKKTNNSNEAGNNIEKNEPLSSDVFHSNTNVETSIIDESTDLSRLSHTDNLSHATGSIQKVRGLCKKLTAPNSNKSLLKTVLQSNFVSKRFEGKDYSNESKKIASSKKEIIVSNRKLTISKSEQSGCSAQLNVSNWPNTKSKCEISIKDANDSELKFDSKFPVLMPFENLSKSETPASSEKCLFDLIPVSKNCNSSLPSNFEFSYANNELHKTSGNSELKYSDLTNSQNLSIQSNEISPISEIISNVSKCQFGRISENENMKEVFEENSLKLLIPESQEKSKNENTFGLKQEFLEARSYSNPYHTPNTSPNKLYKSTDLNSVDVKQETDESESCKLDHDFGNNCVTCRFCQQNMNSMEILSQHLKEIHDIPLLKKHSNQPCFSSELAYSEKLSPPKLNLGISESCSESEIDNPHSWSEPINSSDLKTSNKCGYDTSDLNSCNAFDTSEEIVCGSSVLDASEEVVCKYSKLDTSKKVVHDSSELNAPDKIVYNSSGYVTKEIVEDSSELNTSKKAVENSSESNVSEEVGDSSELNTSKELTCDYSELDTSEEILGDYSELNMREEIVHDSELNMREEIVHDSELDACEKFVGDYSELNACQEIVGNSSELDTSEEIVDNYSKSDISKGTMPDSLELGVSEKVRCNYLKLDASKKIVCDSSELNASEEVVCDSSESYAFEEGDYYSGLDTSKKLCDYSKLNPSSEIVHDSSELDAPSDIMCDYSKLDTFKKVGCASLGFDTYKNETCENNLCTLLSKQCEQNGEAIVHSSPHNLEKSFRHAGYKNNKEDYNKLLTILPRNPLITNSKQQPKEVPLSAPKNKLRRHSFSDTDTEFQKFCKNHSVIPNNKNSFNDLKNNFFGRVRKSLSLPSLKISFQIINSQTPCPNSRSEKCTDSEISSGDNTISSSVTDNSEICKSSCGSSSSSHNTSPRHWNKITIGPSFIIPNPSLSSSLPKLGRKKAFLRSKFSGKNLIIQGLKTYKKQKKNKKAKVSNFIKKSFCQKKCEPNNTFNPIILTLKASTEISDFLKTHKQPIVKLIRLKENEFGCLLNQKHDPVSRLISNKYNMREAVVKLERIVDPSPCDIDKMILINQEFLVPNLLSQDTHRTSLTMQNHQHEAIKCPNSFYVNSDNADLVPEVSIMNRPPTEGIELTVLNNSDSCESDSVQFLGTITRDERCQIKTEDLCSKPSTKECFVVLKRVSM